MLCDANYHSDGSYRVTTYDAATGEHQHSNFDPNGILIPPDDPPPP